jgi:hypothetical protein
MLSVVLRVVTTAETVTLTIFPKTKSKNHVCSMLVILKLLLDLLSGVERAMFAKNLVCGTVTYRTNDDIKAN